MKLFAFLLASLFISEATTPAFCMTRCLFEQVSDSCNMEKSTCCKSKEVAECSLYEGKGISERTGSQLPCNDCCVPSCAIALCSCYFQDVTDLNFSPAVISLAGQLPSNNGIPVSGFLDECFQPPEVI